MTKINFSFWWIFWIFFFIILSISLYLPSIHRIPASLDSLDNESIKVYFNNSFFKETPSFGTFLRKITSPFEPNSYNLHLCLEEFPIEKDCSFLIDHSSQLFKTKSEIRNLTFLPGECSNVGVFEKEEINYLIKNITEYQIIFNPQGNKEDCSAEFINSGYFQLAFWDFLALFFISFIAYSGIVLLFNEIYKKIFKEELVFI